jgi:hypothetical protein
MKRAQHPRFNERDAQLSPATDGVLEVYRSRARECLRRADATNEPILREEWLYFASRWTDMANDFSPTPK